MATEPPVVSVFCDKAVTESQRNHDRETAIGIPGISLIQVRRLFFPGNGLPHSIFAVQLGILYCSANSIRFDVIAFNQMKHKSYVYCSLMLLIALGLGTYVLFGANFLAGLVNAGGLRSHIELDESAVEQIGVVQDRRLTEISGIGMSHKYPELFWVHNDSGNPPELFLISSAGHTVAHVQLVGANNIDWEDMCVFEAWGKSYVCVADVGDNNGTRNGYQLYFFEEPVFQADTKSEKPVELKIEEFKRLDFEYEDGSGNCEAIAFDTHQNAIFLCKKRLDRSRSTEPLGIYRIPLSQDLTWGNSSVANRVAEIAEYYVTAMDFSTDSRRLLIRNYVSAKLFVRPEGWDWSTTLKSALFRQIPLALQRQGEAICWSKDGQFAFIVSEFVRSPIWQINIEQVFSANQQDFDTARDTGK